MLSERRQLTRVHLRPQLGSTARLRPGTLNRAQTHSGTVYSNGPKTARDHPATGLMRVSMTPRKPDVGTQVWNKKRLPSEQLTPVQVQRLSTPMPIMGTRLNYVQSEPQVLSQRENAPSINAWDAVIKCLGSTTGTTPARIGPAEVWTARATGRSVGNTRETYHEWLQQKQGRQQLNRYLPTAAGTARAIARAPSCANCVAHLKARLISLYDSAS